MIERKKKRERYKDEERGGWIKIGDRERERKRYRKRWRMKDRRMRDS